MSNKIDKPKQAAPRLIEKMKSKGVTFNIARKKRLPNILPIKTITYAPPRIVKIIKSTITVQILENT